MSITSNSGWDTFECMMFLSGLSNDEPGAKGGWLVLHASCHEPAKRAA